MRDNSFRQAGVLRAPHVRDAAPDGDDDPIDRVEVAARLERMAGGSAADAVDRAGAEALLTDAAAVVLLAERERLVAKRRRAAALLDAAIDADAAAEAIRLGDQERAAQQEIDLLRALMAVVRRRVEVRLAS